MKKENTLCFECIKDPNNPNNVILDQPGEMKTIDVSKDRKNTLLNKCELFVCVFFNSTETNLLMLLYLSC